MEALLQLMQTVSTKIWDIFRVVNQSQEHPGSPYSRTRAFSGKSSFAFCFQGIN